MKNCLLKSLMVVLMLSAFAVTSGKTSATITTKTVEEYQGVKKN